MKSSYIAHLIRRTREVFQEDGLLLLCEKSFKYLSRIAYYPYCCLKLKTDLNLRNDLNKSVEFCFSGCGGLIKPLQIQSEVQGLLNILKALKPRLILEIGTAHGGTLFLFSRVAAEDAHLISVDLPGGRFGGGYPNWKRSLYGSFALPKQRVSLIRGNSHDKATYDRIKDALEGNQLDFLFLDGDHSYEGVKMDFEMYSSLVRSKGVIAFHDIVSHPSETGVGAGKFWRETKVGHEYTEVVEDWNQGWGGIGLIRM